MSGANSHGTIRRGNAFEHKWHKMDYGTKMLSRFWGRLFPMTLDNTSGSSNNMTVLRQFRMECDGLGIWILFLLVWTSLLFALGLQWPRLTMEDGVVESISAVLFAIASAVALVRSMTSRTIKLQDRILLVLLVPLCALLALSEISFGARVGLVSPPDMYGGGEFDGGHDVIILTLRLLRDNPTWAALAAAALLFCLIAVVGLGWRYRKEAALFVRSNATEINMRFALAFAVLVVAVGLDLVPSFKAGILEEMLELTVGLLLVSAVTFRPRAAMASLGLRSGDGFKN